MNYQHLPTARCELAHATVSTAQTQAECARAHNCPPGRHCPLGACFANVHAANRGLYAADFASNYASCKAPLAEASPFADMRRMAGSRSPNTR